MKNWDISNWLVMEFKNHPANLVADSYFGILVAKHKCIRHFQKRIGTWLHNLRSKHKEKLNNGKGISGRGCLTVQMIIKLQNLYWTKLTLEYKQSNS